MTISNRILTNYTNRSATNIQFTYEFTSYKTQYSLQNTPKIRTNIKITKPLAKETSSTMLNITTKIS